MLSIILLFTCVSTQDFYHCVSHSFFLISELTAAADVFLMPSRASVHRRVMTDKRCKAVDHLQMLECKSVETEQVNTFVRQTLEANMSQS